MSNLGITGNIQIGIIILTFLMQIVHQAILEYNGKDQKVQAKYQ